MRILNSCVVKQDSILHTGVCVRLDSPAAHFLCFTARIRQDISVVWFCGCKLLWRSDEYVLLPCFNVQPDIFAIMNCCVVALNLFSSDIVTWIAGSLYSVQWYHKLWAVRVEEYAYCINKFRENVGLETWIWRQIVTTQTAHTKHKWTPYATEWNPPWKFSAYATGWYNTS